MILVAFSVICNFADQPIHDGLRLLRSLNANTVVKIYSDRDTEFVTRWCTLNGVTEFDLIERHVGPESEWVWTSAMRPSSMVVTDPYVAAWAVEAGIPALLACNPKHARPEHRPASKSWGVLVAEMDRQLGLETLPDEEE